MSSILHVLPSNSLQTIQSYATRNPSRTGLITSAALLSLTLPWLIDNYRKFVDLGDFGVKPRPLGYVFAMLMHPFGSETTSTTMYDDDPNQETWIRDPDSIPERRGDRPKTGWHSVPHRQINKIPSEDMKKRLDNFFNALPEKYSTLIETVPSPHERLDPGLVIHSSISTPHAVAKSAWREIAHIHPRGDHSLHVVLAPMDCKLVIERGWGERHPLSGTRLLPKEYVFVYAPRDDEELEVVQRVVLAAVGFMTNNRDLK